jgi:hypothetical protein
MVIKKAWYGTDTSDCMHRITNPGRTDASRHTRTVIACTSPGTRWHVNSSSCSSHLRSTTVSAGSRAAVVRCAAIESRVRAQLSPISKAVRTKGAGGASAADMCISGTGVHRNRWGPKRRQVGSKTYTSKLIHWWQDTLHIRQAARPATPLCSVHCHARRLECGSVQRAPGAGGLHTRIVPASDASTRSRAQAT